MPTGRRGAGHIVSPRAQLVIMYFVKYNQIVYSNRNYKIQ